MMALVESYLAVRRALGFKLDTVGWRLRMYARFAEARGDRHMRTATVIAWAATARSPHARHIRMRDAVHLAAYLRAEDPAHEMPPRDAFAYCWHPRPPYVYSAEEIDRILQAMGKLRPVGSSRGPTYQTLFALLAVTGMRVREALDLRIEDLTADGLLIRESKFRKSRLLPIHPTTRAALTAYRERWRPLAAPEDVLFVSLWRRPLAYSTAAKLFLVVARDLGLREPAPAPGVPQRGPRIHDLRHAFAVRSLEDCPEGQEAINRHMLALSTYMGHTMVRYTYWYLHATPQLMGDIADACEALDSGGAP